MNEPSTPRHTSNAAGATASDLLAVQGVPAARRLFIIWEHTRSHEAEILRVLRERFVLESAVEVEWSPEMVESNFRRLFGKSIIGPMSLPSEAGGGPFLAIVVRDKQGERNFHADVLQELTATSQWFGERRVHCSGSARSFCREMTLIFGSNFLARLNIRKNSEWNGKTESFRGDLIGARGWKNFDELFEIINPWAEYVVLRNFDEFELWPNVDRGWDVDFLCRDTEAFASAANGRRTDWRDYKIGYHVLVGGKQVRFDIRQVGDDYYDAAWETHILANRQLHGAVYVPQTDDHFFSLLYHAALQKKPFPRKYVRPLRDLAESLGVSAIADHFRDNADLEPHWETSRTVIAKVLSAFLIERGYECTFPNDLNNLLRLDITQQLDPRVRPPIVLHRLTKPFRKQVSRLRAVLTRYEYERRQAATVRRLAKHVWRGSSISTNRLMTLAGTVASGRGETPRPPLTLLASASAEALLGGAPVSGTLNVVLHQPIEFRCERALAADAAHAFWATTLNGGACLAYRWRGCPLHILQVVSHRHLRTEEGLRDEDRVILQIEEKMIVPVRLQRRLAWQALWRYREALFYSSRSYLKAANRWRFLRERSDQRMMRT